MQARPMAHIVKKGGKVVHFSLHTPDDILPGVHSQEDLQAALDFYSNPFVHSLLPDGKHAQRWHVTRVRPALRWFCKKYDTDVPEWLKGNGVYDNMNEEERQDLYGQPELDVMEFDDEDAPPPADDEKETERVPQPKPKKKGGKDKKSKKADKGKKPVKGKGK